MTITASHFVNTSQAEHWRMEATKKWLEISGPLYFEMFVTLTAITRHHAILTMPEGDVVKYEPGDMSIASW